MAADHNTNGASTNSVLGRAIERNWSTSETGGPAEFELGTPIFSSASPAVVASNATKPSEPRQENRWLMYTPNGTPSTMAVVKPAAVTARFLPRLECDPRPDAMA